MDITRRAFLNTAGASVLGVALANPFQCLAAKGTPGWRYSALRLVRRKITVRR